MDARVVSGSVGCSLLSGISCRTVFRLLSDSRLIGSGGLFVCLFGLNLFGCITGLPWGMLALGEKLSCGVWIVRKEASGTTSIWEGSEAVMAARMEERDTSPVWGKVRGLGRSREGWEGMGASC